MRSTRAAFRAPLAILTLVVVLFASGCSLLPGGGTRTGSVGECPEGTLVSSADELAAAAASASAGDVIVLNDGTYPGNFTLEAEGTAEQPITLCGTADAVIDGGSLTSGYSLHLSGARFWHLQGFSITGGQKGLMLDESSNNTISTLTISGTGDEAVHLRTHSSNNLVENTRISATGRSNPKFGEGIYVGSAASNWCELTACEADRSDSNRLVGNIISDTTAESVDVKEGTSNGEISANQFDGSAIVEADSLLDIKGTGWSISDNVGVASPEDGAQVHLIEESPGSGNTFSGNTFSAAVGGIAINIVGDAAGAGNMVACSNVATNETPVGAGPRLTNIDCSTS